jgi:hypothetical protein
MHAEPVGLKDRVTDSAFGEAPIAINCSVLKASWLSNAGFSGVPNTPRTNGPKSFSWWSPKVKDI